MRKQVVHLYGERQSRVEMLTKALLALCRDALAPQRLEKKVQDIAKTAERCI